MNLVVEIEAQNIAQWYAISLCVQLCENATTIHGKLKHASGDDAM